MSLNTIGDVLNVGEQRVLLNGQFVTGDEISDQVLVERLNLRQQVVEDHLQLADVHGRQDASIELLGHVAATLGFQVTFGLGGIQ